MIKHIIEYGIMNIIKNNINSIIKFLVIKKEKFQNIFN